MAAADGNQAGTGGYVLLDDGYPGLVPLTKKVLVLVVIHLAHCFFRFISFASHSLKSYIHLLGAFLEKALKLAGVVLQIDFVQLGTLEYTIIVERMDKRVNYLCLLLHGERINGFRIGEQGH